VVVVVVVVVVVLKQYKNINKYDAYKFKIYNKSN